MGRIIIMSAIVATNFFIGCFFLAQIISVNKDVTHEKIYSVKDNLHASTSSSYCPAGKLHKANLVFIKKFIEDISVRPNDFTVQAPSFIAREKYYISTQYLHLLGSVVQSLRGPPMG